MTETSLDMTFAAEGLSFNQITDNPLADMILKSLNGVGTAITGGLETASATVSPTNIASNISTSLTNGIV